MMRSVDDDRGVNDVGGLAAEPGREQRDEGGVIGGIDHEFGAVPVRRERHRVGDLLVGGAERELPDLDDADGHLHLRPRPAHDQRRVILRETDVDADDEPGSGAGRPGGGIARRVGHGGTHGKMP